MRPEGGKFWDSGGLVKTRLRAFYEAFSGPWNIKIELFGGLPDLFDPAAFNNPAAVRVRHNWRMPCFESEPLAGGVKLDMVGTVLFQQPNRSLVQFL